MQQTADTGAFVYVVDDDANISRLVAKNLTSRGYQVKEFQSGRVAMENLEIDRPDLVLLDLVMPDCNGLEIAKMIRQQSGVPIIMLSVLAETASKSTALDLGADDYITKPFQLEELLARVRAMLRRSRYAATQSSESSNCWYRNGGLSVNLDSKKVTSHHKQVSLTPKEWATLRTLLKNAGRVVAPGDLLGEIKGRRNGGDAYNARTYIARLRRKLEPDPRNPRYVLLERGFGYRMADAEQQLAQ